MSLKIIIFFSKYFRCQYCAKCFTRREHMQNHVRKHTGDTPFKCDICKKSFTRKEHYVNHYMWHTGELLMKFELEIRKKAIKFFAYKVVEIII